MLRHACAFAHTYTQMGQMSMLSPFQFSNTYCFMVHNLLTEANLSRIFTIWLVFTCVKCSECFAWPSRWSQHVIQALNL